MSSPLCRPQEERVGRRLVGLVATAMLLAGCGGETGRAPERQAGPTATRAEQEPRQPEQPASGPGGAERRHRQVRRSEVPVPAGTVTLFEPDQPRPAQAPVVVFTQGVDFQEYQGWIDHLVGRGNIVVFQNMPYEGISLAERRRGPAGGCAPPCGRSPVAATCGRGWIRW